MGDDFWQDVQNVAKAAIPFVGGGLSFLGGILTNESNADIARANRHFLRNMYKKRYQFTVDDMRKAGLNPILAANGGSVGSVPSVSTPTMSNALEAGVSGTLSTARALSDIHAQSISNAKVEADAKLADANTGLVNSKKLSQDIQNQHLEPKVRALAEKAQHEASIANSAAVMQRAREYYAQVLASNEVGYTSDRHSYMTAKQVGEWADSIYKSNRWKSMPDPKKAREAAEVYLEGRATKARHATFQGYLNSAIRLLK